MVSRRWLCSVLFCVSCFFAHSQSSYITGTITDKQSDEPIPFASVFFKKDGRGILTDSLGHFSLYKVGVAMNDSLIISSVGYDALSYLLSSLKDSSSLSVQLIVSKVKNEVVVKGKYNRALWFWHRVIDHKKYNDLRRFDNYSYEVYNKLELDLDNVDKEKLASTPLLKKLDFVLKYVILLRKTGLTCLFISPKHSLIFTSSASLTRPAKSSKPPLQMVSITRVSSKAWAILTRT